jgi:hypothetical protein
MFAVDSNESQKTLKFEGVEAVSLEDFRHLCLEYREVVQETHCVDSCIERIMDFPEHYGDYLSSAFLPLSMTSEVNYPLRNRCLLDSIY